MNFDVKKVVKKLGQLESSLVKKFESGAVYKDLRRFADGQTKVLRQKVKGSKDAKKVLAFIDQRKKKIERIAADLPSEVNAIRAFIKSQSRELEKIGNDLIKKAKAGKISGSDLKSAIRAATTKKAARRTTRKTATKQKTGTTRKATRKKK